ncbi:hypothetical protein BV90_01335 [Brucella melitensis]|nr:hypothetical protein BV91_06900 [Brucella melitensis]KEA02947.1 hypothetical protein BV90_01335 [Brucella melitensis]
MPVFELVAPLIMANSTVLKLRQGAMSMDDFPSRTNQMQRNAIYLRARFDLIESDRRSNPLF